MHHADELNHFGIGWTEQSIGTTRAGTSKRTSILVKDQNAGSGKFTIDQCDESGKLLAHVQGTIAARRIVVDTHVKQIL